MADTLKNCTVAILVANGFEESELAEPKKALEKAGATVHIVSPEENSVRSWSHGKWSDNYRVDVQLDKADSADYDALLLPGGVINPDKLRLSEKAIDFIAQMGKDEKPIAAICHGPWTLINADLVKDKTVTSWPSITVDLKNAGAKWVDKEVVTDGNIITSRKPDDIPAFNEAMIELFSQACSK